MHKFFFAYAINKPGLVKLTVPTHLTVNNRGRDEWRRMEGPLGESHWKLFPFLVRQHGCDRACPKTGIARNENGDVRRM